MKALVVGDPHVRPDDLEEGWRLIEQIEGLITGYKPDAVVFLGDLFNNFAVTHISVIAFWRKAFARLNVARPGTRIVALVGNHDTAHDCVRGEHALLALTEFALIIDEPRVIDGFLFLPYFRDPKGFVAACNQYHEIHTAFAHQEFNGSEFESGIYSKEGVLPGDIPQKLVISGHIHKPQEFANIWYPGSPRWLTVSDANQDRYLWVVDFDSEGRVTDRIKASSSFSCLRITKIVETPDSPPVTSLAGLGRLIVDIHGPPSFVAERKAVWKGRARVRTFPVMEKSVKVKESEGIPQAFDKYVGEYKAMCGTSSHVLRRMAKERGVCQ